MSCCVSRVLLRVRLTILNKGCLFRVGLFIILCVVVVP